MSKSPIWPERRLYHMFKDIEKSPDPDTLEDLREELIGRVGAALQRLQEGPDGVHSPAFEAFYDILGRGPHEYEDNTEDNT